MCDFLFQNHRIHNAEGVVFSIKQNRFIEKQYDTLKHAYPLRIGVFFAASKILVFEAITLLLIGGCCHFGRNPVPVDALKSGDFLRLVS